MSLRHYLLLINIPPLSPPGHLRRLVAMQYLELTNQECEFVSLSRDTTESDLKQRREIRGSTASYLDQVNEWVNINITNLSAHCNM